VLADFSFECFVQLFEEAGYEKCTSWNLEVLYEKVALYAIPGTDEFTHAAAQLRSGRWTSKLGAFEDITHNSLGALEGSTAQEYGEVRQILRRRCCLWGVLARCFFKVVTLIQR
jgi:hypothetical protein